MEKGEREGERESANKFLRVALAIAKGRIPKQTARWIPRCLRAWCDLIRACVACGLFSLETANIFPRIADVVEDGAANLIKFVFRIVNQKHSEFWITWNTFTRSETIFEYFWEFLSQVWLNVFFVVYYMQMLSKFKYFWMRQASCSERFFNISRWIIMFERIFANSSWNYRK